VQGFRALLTLTKNLRFWFFLKNKLNRMVSLPVPHINSSENINSGSSSENQIWLQSGCYIGGPKPVVNYQLTLGLVTYFYIDMDFGSSSTCK
jgi:hypothetical protein